MVTHRLNVTRMNPSNLYEQYFAGFSRQIQSLVRHEVDAIGGPSNLDPVITDRVFDIILQGVAKLDTEQYQGYAVLDTESKLSVVLETYYKECYLYYKISSKKKPYDIVGDIEGTVYEPKPTPVTYYGAGGNGPFVTKKAVMIAPQYMMLLAKTPEEYLVCSSAKTNHYDLPVSASSAVRQTMPYRNSPTKILSETESRLYTSYVSQEGIAELKDRANSVETHAMIYKHLLEADKPTDIGELINRAEHPLGTDKALDIVNSILNCSGIELVQVDQLDK